MPLNTKHLLLISPELGLNLDLDAPTVPLCRAHSVAFQVELLVP
jgi:hypothetical protein